MRKSAICFQARMLFLYDMVYELMAIDIRRVVSAKRYKGSFGASVVLQAAIRFHLARSRHLRKKRLAKTLLPCTYPSVTLLAVANPSQPFADF
jgi:hypothetical protein